MTKLRDREIVHASYLWRDAADEPWLLVFDFAEVGGRLECIGMAMRSFVWDEAGEPGDKHRAYWSPTPEERASIDRAVKHPEDMSDHKLVDDLNRRDPDAAGALGAGYADLAETWNEQGLLPRRLKSTDLRGLPLGDVVVRVRRLLAEVVDDFMPPQSAMDAGDEAVETWQNNLREALGTEQSSGFTRGGRPPKYSRADLERAASLYRHAFETQDSPSPTKYVAEQMGLSPDAASKVVRKCRDVGLLGRTSRGRAGVIDNLTPNRVTPNPETPDEGSTL